MMHDQKNIKKSYDCHCFKSSLFITHRKWNSVALLPTVRNKKYTSDAILSGHWDSPRLIQKMPVNNAIFRVPLFDRKS